jgi:copper chaperone
MSEITLKIEGMSCQHCVMNVKKAVDGVDGVNSSDVSVGFTKVVYDKTKASKDEIVRAIQHAGYKVVD